VFTFNGLEKPDFGGPHGEEWKRLLPYRNGLVHAKASRPATDTDRNAIHDKKVLDELETGWATRVVVERVRRLHSATKTDPPSWIVDP